jgi:hypothetical protein
MVQSNTSQEGFDLKDLLTIVNDATVAAKDKIKDLKERGDSISIGEMFELQMKMNQLSQLSEMSTAVVAASHGAVISMTRNIK